MSDKKTIIVTQKKSPIGRQAYQRQTLIGLGLNKIGRSCQLEDTPSICWVLKRRKLMNLNEIKDNNKATKDRKRIGRGIGSGTGKTSGKGHKGQKARSGVAVKGFEGGQMPIHRRLPKRGFTNINRVPFVELNLDNIEKLIANKKINNQKAINSEYLLELGLIKKITSKVKLLAKGEIKSKINIEVSAVSSKARELVEKVGGTVTVLEKKKQVVNKDKKSEA